MELLLPIACVSCERLVAPADSGIVCGLCLSRLPFLPSPRCDRCGHPRGTGDCRWCDLLPRYVRAVRSVCWLPGESSTAIVHALKYAGWTRVAGEMALRMSRLPWPADVLRERGALIPVPLSRSRERERGYNQSALLAEALSGHWSTPVWNDALRRVRDTRSQTELTPGERLRNLAGSIATSDARKAEIAGMHLVIVDDVVTTAATLNACARALFESGARIISYVTFGRARASGDRL